MASSRFRRLSREFVWVGLGQVAAVLGAVVGVRILTSVLPPEVYGRLALGMTAATLITQGALGPLANGATRFFAAAKEAGTFLSYLGAVKSLLLRAIAATVLVALMLCLGLVVTGHSDWIGLTLAAIGFALLFGCNAMLNGMQNAARQRAVVALHQGLASWGRFLLAAAMVLWLGASGTVVIFGYALAILVVLVSQGWFFRRTLLSDGDVADTGDSSQGRWKTEIFTYAWPFAVWGIPIWAQFASDRWSLQAFCSMKDVGRYAVLYQLGYYPVTISTNLIVQLIYPVFFHRAGDASDPSRLRHVYGLNRRLTMVALVFTVMAVALAWVLHGTVFRFLAAPEYRMVSWMLPAMVLAGGLFATAQLAVVSVLSGARTHRLILPKIVTALLGVLLNVLGAAYYGMMGVVCAMVVAAAVYLFWILCLVRNRDYQSEA